MQALGQSAPNRALRETTLLALAEISSGRFAERMRLDAASRFLVVVKRVLVLRASGLMAEPMPSQAQRRAVDEIDRIAGRWNPTTTTATEFVHDLAPGDVRLLVDLAAAWAGAAAPS